MRSRLFSQALIVAAGAAALMISPTVRADWVPSDGHKMHFPQLPDPQGWDVNFTFPKVIADDWQCSETGPVADIHFWLSFRRDFTVPIRQVHVSIHDDVPDPDGPTGPLWSHPGNLLWQRNFLPGEFVPNPQVFTGPQKWFDPNTGEVNPPTPTGEPDHFQFYQINIRDIPNPFIQEFGKIYWLDLVLDIDNSEFPEARVGWKTSLEHFNDDAVWADYVQGADGLPVPPGPDDWRELRDPHFPQISLDMAFVITPEPGSALLAGLAVAGIWLGRIRR
jgi:hypothetical protein